MVNKVVSTDIYKILALIAVSVPDVYQILKC